MYLKFVIIFFISPSLFSQIILGKIVDERTQKVIEYASISSLNKGSVISSNELGEFEFKVIDSKDILVVSALSYETKNISLESFTKKQTYVVNVSLKPKIIELKDVIVNNKKIDYKIIKLPPQNVVTFDKNTKEHGECVLIENTTLKRGKLFEVIVKFDTIFGKNSKNRLTNFRIYFYEYNIKEAMPGKEVAYKDVMIATESKVNKLVFELDDLDIPFTENGICVSVIALNRNIETKNIKVLNSSNVKFKRTNSLFEYTVPKENFMLPNWKRNFKYSNEWTNEKLKLLTNDLLSLNLTVNVKAKIER